jgi:carbonic anhydrase/acetyltransferase-like protein (isoleucine patch superfamily)
MSLTGDTTSYGQTQNITGDNNALYGAISADVLNITDAITFQEYGSGDSGSQSNFISFNNFLNAGVFNNKLQSGTFEFDMEGTTALAITNNSVGLKDSGGIMTYLSNQDIIDTVTSGGGLQDAYTIIPLYDPNETLTATNINYALDNVFGGYTDNIFLPNETTSAVSIGMRYMIFPKTQWSNLSPSGVVISPLTSSTILFNGSAVSSVTMTKSFQYLQFYCVSKAGSGICWVVTDEDPTSLLSSNNTWTNINRYENPLCNIRSSWATGGTPGLGLYRNIGEILTPFSYSPTARRISLNDEINGELWDIDFSNNLFESALDLNNFLYYVDIGRSLSVAESLSTGADIIIGTNLTVGTDCNVNAGLTVEGDSILNGNVQVQGTLEARGLTRMAKSICLSGGMDIDFPNLTTTTSIGPNTMPVCPSTAYADDVTAIGSGVLEVCGNTHTGTTAIGRQAFGQAVNLGNGNTAIGYRAGYNITSGNVSNCTFIGNNTGVLNGANTYTNAMALGNGAIISNSQTVVLGGANLLVIVPSNLQIQSKFFERASGTIRSAAFSLPTVAFTYYSINSVTPFSITLNTPDGTHIGARVTFRRILGDPNNAITSASNNVYPWNSNTPDNELLAAGVYSCTIVNLQISSGVFGWFRIDSNKDATAGTFVDLTTNQSIAGKKTFTEELTFTNQIMSACPTTIVGSGTGVALGTLTAPLYRFYSVVNTVGGFNITLPTADVSLLGVHVTFRRVSGTLTNNVGVLPVNTVVPLNSVSVGSVLMPANVCQITIACMYNTPTNLRWMVVC